MEQSSLKVVELNQNIKSIIITDILKYNLVKHIGI